METPKIISSRVVVDKETNTIHGFLTLEDKRTWKHWATITDEGLGDSVFLFEMHKSILDSAFESLKAYGENTKAAGARFIVGELR